MPRSYEQHLLEVRAREETQQAQRKTDTRSQLSGLHQSTDKGPSHTPSAPWRDSPSWREHDGWVQESARHMRGD